uniref:Stress-inducible protein n=1 Tax=Oryza sativa subsp. japonica TaxID=39947 RepID=Q9AYD1_ORYSJ|nr:putative stress-inducible protein [Oryza sativa Japonica Group]
MKKCLEVLIPVTFRKELTYHIWNSAIVTYTPVVFTTAIQLDPTDATLHSNRSFCYLKSGEAREALVDAKTCIGLKPDWPKGYYRKGAALMSLKEYKEACDAFMDGVKLDPASGEMHEAFWEAAAALKKKHLAGKTVSSFD